MRLLQSVLPGLRQTRRLAPSSFCLARVTRHGERTPGAKRRRRGAENGLWIAYPPTTVVVWANLEGGLLDVYEMLPGFLAGLLAVVFFSTIGRPPSAAVTQLFDERPELRP